MWGWGVACDDDSNYVLFASVLNETEKWVIICLKAQREVSGVPVCSVCFAWLGVMLKAVSNEHVCSVIYCTD